MDKNCDAFKSPVNAANAKLAALRALAKHCNLPDDDLPLLAIVVSQSMEVVQRDFLSVVGPLLCAPPEIMKNMLILMDPLRHCDTKLKAKPELLDLVIADCKPRPVNVEA